MKQRSAACPACGGPVLFSPGAVVTVCDYCQSAVGRKDKKIEDYGKVSDLVQTSSRIRRGMTGKFRSKRFSVVGHVQYQHPAGGVWDEWYLAFPSGKWGWLAESQGKTHLMFERRLRRDYKLPAFESLDAGQTVRVVDVEFQVAEKGVALAGAAEGEIPWPFFPGAEHRFADLQNTAGAFATFEYGESQTMYIGEEIDLDTLDLQGHGWDPSEEVITVSATQLNCPKCGGPIALRAPDQSLRVTCQNCNSMLDVESGKLAFLKTLREPEVQVLIPLGSEGTIDGVTYTLIGFMERHAMYNGRAYPWSEYLLYEPKAGFRWLVYNDRHWSFVSPVDKPLDISRMARSNVRYDGDNFRIYDRGQAHVRHVLGEFYWKVEVGNSVRTADFISPPRMISFENSAGQESAEIIASVGRYMTTDEVESAFGIQKLPRPWGIGPIQPAPRFHYGFFISWIVFIAVMVGVFTKYVTVQRGGGGSDPWLLFYGILFLSAVPIGIMVYKYSIEVNRWKDSDYNPYASD
jgi:hypothetical protein